MIAPTGGTRVFIELMNGLARRGHKVTLTTHVPPPFPFELSSEVNINLVKDFRIITLMAKVQVALDRYMKIPIRNMHIWDTAYTESMPECDVNIGHSGFDSFPIYRSRRGIPVHYMLHDEALIHTCMPDKAIVEESYCLPIRRFVNSIWLRKRMEKKIGRKLPIVNPGVNLDVFRPFDIAVNKSKPRIVCYGSPIKWKGFGDFLKAAAIIKKKVEAEIVVFGSRRLQRYESQIAFKFVHNLSDTELASLYSSANVVVCPSWYESFPLPPLEAMACGTPVVTTRYGTEDYAIDGKNSLIVQPNNPEQIAEAVMRILSDKSLSENLRKEGLNTARRFTLESFLDRFEAIIEGMVK